MRWDVEKSARDDALHRRDGGKTPARGCSVVLLSFRALHHTKRKGTRRCEAEDARDSGGFVSSC